jgi:steroid delta-isomerase-like uncharacterized protein
MALDANTALIRRWWEALNAGTALDVIDEIYSTDYVLHDPSLPEPVRGLDGVREFIGEVTRAFPDGQVTVEDLVAEGDREVQRVTYRGTHQGEFQGVPATGKAVEAWVMVISRLADGKIAEEWQLVDTLGLLQQLGRLPDEVPGS